MDILGNPEIKRKRQGGVIAVLGSTALSNTCSDAASASNGREISDDDATLSPIASSITLHRYASAQKYCVKTAFPVLTPEECKALIKHSEAAGYERALVNTGSGQQIVDEVRTGSRCVLDLPILLERAVFDRLHRFLPRSFAARRDNAWKYRLTYGQNKIAHWILDGKSFENLSYGQQEIDSANKSILPSLVEQEGFATFLSKTSSSLSKSTVWRLAGLNPRFRFLRYRMGEKFGPHFDGSYSALFVESNVETASNGPLGFWQVVTPTGTTSRETDDEAPVLQRSFLTVMLYLTDNSSSTGSGFTHFLDEETGNVIGTCTPSAGTALIFEHDMYHEGSSIELAGEVKYAVRTDAMYVRDEDWDAFCRARAGSDSSRTTEFPMSIREFEQLIADARCVKG